MKKFLLYVSGILFVLVLLSQLQPNVVQLAGGVDGSFGLRPTSHKCIGITISRGGWDIFPQGDLEFRLVRFYFRYSVSSEDDRPLCVGQDIWYGE